MISIEKTTANIPSYHVYFDKKYIGDFIMDVDGFYYFWISNDSQGCWSSYSLKLISSKLEELNKEWEEKLFT